MRFILPWSLVLLLECLYQCAAAPPRGYLLNSRASLANSEGKAFAQPGLTSHGMPLSYILSPIHQSQAPSSSSPQHSSPNIHTDDEPATSPYQTRRFEITESIATPRSSLLPPESVLDTGVTTKEQVLLQRRQGKDGGPDPVVVVFGTLCTVAGTIVLILCGRSVLHYFRMPRRDLVADHIDRFNLERELEEIEGARLRMLFSRDEGSNPQPPPPYQEAPKYEDAMKTTRTPNSPRS